METFSIHVLSFDVGVKNFAWCISHITPTANKVIDIDVVDLTLSGDGTESYDVLSRRNVLKFLHEHREKWEKVDIILIEQQFFNQYSKTRKGKFKKAGSEANVKAIKMAETVVTYFLTRFPFKELVIFPSFHKTQQLNAPKNLTNAGRKKWSIEKAKELMQQNEDSSSLAKLALIKKRKQKLDDVCDAYIQIHAWLSLNAVTTSPFK